MALSQADVLAGLKEIVEEVAGIPAASIELDKNFTDDLEVDSLSMVEVVVAAEDRFGIKIPDEKVTLHALWERVVPSEVERTPQVTEDLAETGFDLSAYLLASLILSGAGLLLIRKTKRS